MTAETRTPAAPERYSPEWWSSAPLQRMIIGGPRDGNTVGYHGAVLLMPVAQAPILVPSYLANGPSAASMPVAEYRIGRLALEHGEIVAAYRYVGTR